ncbi:MAG: hypothetical protein ACI8R9_000429 [Paraglaciecola sp.]|jgi:hypothetical protein
MILTASLSSNKPLVILSLILLSFDAYTQSTPTEFAEMSFEDLFALSIDDEGNSKEKITPWSFVYQFKLAEFEGYLDDDKSLSNDYVLWSPGDIRNDKNFPIIPTTITQKAHLVTIGYQFSLQWQGHLTLPYISQSTDHISIVGNYNAFTINSSGYGDTVLSTSYKLLETQSSTSWLSMGISLPTGSIDEKGDTPRAPGDQQLPYTMQIGSGTYDFPFQLTYQNIGKHDFNVSLAATIRTGINDRNYRLGNSYSLASRYRFELSPNLQTFIGGEAQYTQAINGQDNALLVPAAFIYPASITNPKYFGGKKISLKTGFNWRLSEQYSLSIQVSKPLYQYLNGPQPKEKWRANIQFITSS